VRYSISSTLDGFDTFDDRPRVGLHRIRRHLLGPKIFQVILHRDHGAMIRAEHRPGVPPALGQDQPLHPTTRLDRSCDRRHARSVSTPDRASATDTPTVANNPRHSSRTVITQPQIGRRHNVHLIRNTFRLVSKRDWDALRRDVKPIYTAPNDDAARAALDRFPWR
jgi:hypothetical protein